MNIHKNSRGKKRIPCRKIIKCEKINDKVPLYEISKDFPIISSDFQNGLINDKDVKSQYIAKYTAKLPFWRKKQYKNVTKCGTKRKSFVDVYDISQDEDMSHETKHKKRKINSRKNVKRPVIKTKSIISNKNANFNQKYSNVLKPVHNRLNILTTNCQSNVINSNLPTVKVNATALSPEKKSEVIFTADIVHKNGKNCDVNTTAVSSDKKSEIIFGADIVEENYKDYFMNTDDLNITSEYAEIDNTPTETKSQEVTKKCLLNLADEFEKSLIIPRMTSTPDTTLLNNLVTKHPLSSKLTELNISSIIPKGKKGFKIPVKICSSLSDKETDSTLFESPVKETQKKGPVKLKAPKKNIQTNLFKNFIEQPKEDDLEIFVLEPKKAYHSPDNFKTHLARTKRISEITKKDAKKCRGKNSFFGRREAGHSGKCQ